MKKILLKIGALVCLLISFPLHHELMGIFSAIALWWLFQPTQQEIDQAEWEKQQKELANKQAEIYTTELARHMAREFAKTQFVTNEPFNNVYPYTYDKKSHQTGLVKH